MKKNIIFAALIVLWLFMAWAKFDVNFNNAEKVKQRRSVKVAEKILSYAEALKNPDKLREKNNLKFTRELFFVLILGVNFFVFFLLGVAFIVLFAFKLRFKKSPLSAENPGSTASIYAAGAIFILWDVIHIAAGLIIYKFNLKSMTIFNAVMIYSAISVFMLFAVYAAVFYGHKRVRLINNLAANILWGFGGYCAILPVVLAASALNDFIFNGIDVSVNPVFNLLSGVNSRSDILMLGFMVVLLGPFVEEVIARAVLFRSLRMYFGLGLSLLVSSFLFSFVHADIFALIPIICIGFVLGAVYEYTGSVLASFITHALWNLSTFAVCMLFLR